MFKGLNRRLTSASLEGRVCPLHVCCMFARFVSRDAVIEHRLSESAAPQPPSFHGHDSLHTHTEDCQHAYRHRENCAWPCHWTLFHTVHRTQDARAQLLHEGASWPSWRHAGPC